MTLNQLFWKLTKEKFHPSWGYFGRSSKNIYNLLKIMLHITLWTLILMLHIRQSICLVLTNVLSTSFLMFHIRYIGHTFDTHSILDTYGAMICSCFRTAFLLCVIKIENAVYKSCQNSTLFFINRLIFHIMNIQNNQSLKFEWKPMLAPLRSVTDWRFAWLHNAFLKYFWDWLNSVQQCQGNFTKDTGQKMFILGQIYEGLKISINSIIEATQFPFWYQVKYVLSEHFCKDPLENWFGRQRSLGLRKGNPSMADFGHNSNAIRNQKNSNQSLMVTLLIVAWLP